MSVRTLREERRRLLILMLFYKNDDKDYTIYSNAIKNINEKLKEMNKIDKLSQLEHFIEKTINKNTPENREQLKKKLQQELLATAKA